MSHASPLPPLSRARSWRLRLGSVLLSALVAALVMAAPPSARAEDELPPLIARITLWAGSQDVTNNSMQPSSVLRVSPYVYPDTVTPHLKLEGLRGGVVTPLPLDSRNTYSPTLADVGLALRVSLDVTAPGYPAQPTQYRSVIIEAPAAPILSGVSAANEVLPGDTVNAAVPEAMLQVFPDAVVTWEWAGITSATNTSGVVEESMLGQLMRVRYTMTSPTKGRATSAWSPYVPVVAMHKNPVTVLVDGEAPGDGRDTSVGARHEAVVVGLTADDEVSYEWRVSGEPNPVVSEESALTVTGWWSSTIRLTVRVTNPAYREAVFTQSFFVPSEELRVLPAPEWIVPGSGVYRVALTDTAGPIDWDMTSLRVSFDSGGGPAVPRGSEPDEIVLGDEAEGRSVWVRIDLSLWERRYYTAFEHWTRIGVVTTRDFADVTHSLTGEAQVGSTLGVSVSEAVAGQQVDVRWYADDEHIATGETLQVTDELRGAALSFDYTLTAPGYRPYVVERTPVGTVPADEPVLRSVTGAKVVISGKAQVGTRLTASFRSTPQVTSAIVWTRGKKVVGRGATYAPRAADAGARLTATATVTQAGYREQTVSATTALVAAPVSLKVSAATPKRSAKQTITVGQVAQGQVVTVRVNGKVVARATVRGNGKLASVRTVRTNGATVAVKPAGKAGLRITFRVAARKGNATVTAAVPGRPTAKATFRIR